MSDAAVFVEAASFLGAALAMGFGALSVALGEGYAAGKAASAISRNTDQSGPVMKSMLIGQAVAESAGIFSLVVAMVLLFSGYADAPWVKGFALIGAGLAMGLSSMGCGLGSGIPAAEACQGIVRQPQAQSQLSTNMLIGSAVTQTPAIFGLVVAFMLMFIDWSTAPAYPTWAYLLSAGLATGLSAIGPGIGNGLTAGQASQSVARMPEGSGPITTTMLIGQTVAQSTVIYGFLVSLILVFMQPEAENLALAAAAGPLAAGLCMGLGGIGPGVGEGIAAAYAVNRIARGLEQNVLITRVMLVGQAVSESTGIYSLIIALVILFVI